LVKRRSTPSGVPATDVPWPPTPLGSVLRKLEDHYGRPAASPPSGPFEWILWEIVAYLADDARRAAAFDALRKTVGLTPQRILAAPPQLLLEITRSGGSIAAEERALRLQTAAQLVSEDFDGSLETVLTLPPLQAKKMLMRFPMTGEPGAEKILLFCGVLPVLALESNGLRATVRLGFGEDRKSYSSTYKSVRAATVDQLPPDCNLLTRAHLLLRQHGQELCLRTEPLCDECPVAAHCRYYRAR
jgi:endonuclease III